MSPPLDFHWLEADLAVGGRIPRGEVPRLASRHDIGAVVDLRAETGGDAGPFDACGISFLHLPTPDRMGVSLDMLERGVDFVEAMRRQGRRVLIHCHFGIGRSATLALCVLAARGVEPLAALALAKDARPVISPSREQYDAWCHWLVARGISAPSYHAFGMVAYRTQASAL
ncbi:MAG: protein-tyrosine phosphatase family protein [Phreatobacter sp.]|uniref:protein-tyrosine phosphatase family protein n=1 Tax=Phreatobacter sp. TaxID=1966341 RepID=UPI004036951F